MYLNRHGKTQYTSRLELDVNTVHIYENYDESFPALNGGDFAVVIAKIAYNKQDHPKPSDFEVLSATTFTDVQGQDVVVAGYPEEVCGKPERYYLFSDSGAVQDDDENRDNIAFVRVNGSKG